jgi:MinD-like ATPase involved in chromosome partitioning or flagellar assembly
MVAGKKGVGKTVLSLNLAVAMARQGLDVTLIEYKVGDDGGEGSGEMNTGDLGRFLGAAPGADLSDAARGTASLADCVRGTTQGVRYVCATPDGMDYGDMENLLRGVSLVSPGICILDAPGGMTTHLLPALAVSWSTLLVTEPELTSLSESLEIKAVAQKLKTRAAPMSAVLNRCNGVAPATVAEVSRLLDSHILSLLPEDPDLQKDPLAWTNNRSMAANALTMLLTNLFFRHGSDV